MSWGPECTVRRGGNFVNCAHTGRRSLSGRTLHRHNLLLLFQMHSPQQRFCAPTYGASGLCSCVGSSPAAVPRVPSWSLPLLPSVGSGQAQALRGLRRAAPTTWGLPGPGIKPAPPALAGGFFTPGPGQVPGKSPVIKSFNVLVFCLFQVEILSG